eukprot:356753-Chlamydomonas_euryale.AAC.2
MILLSRDSFLRYLVLIWPHTDQLRSLAALVACMDNIINQQHATPAAAQFNPVGKPAQCQHLAVERLLKQTPGWIRAWARWHWKQRSAMCRLL